MMEPFGFRELYDEDAAAFARFAEESTTWHELERPMLDDSLRDEDLADASILDVGCGNGRIVDYLVERGADHKNIVGIDFSGNAIKIAKRHASKVQYVQGDTLELPFRPESFDVVTANMMVHTMQDIDTFLESIHTVLTPGGVFVNIDRALDKRTTLEPGTTLNWQRDQTGWGSETPAFNHNYWRIIWDTAFFKGFNSITHWTDREGDLPVRVATRFEKVSPEEKAMRDELFQDAPYFPLERLMQEASRKYGMGLH